ncbi:beta-ketoacyl-[acyl-carrier-protein] synthase family protein [Spirosoma endbachense]|uniref:Beta-ketoacyl-[acyl-carrier-protein] synthase family protein n=1 Tax=Spirosoma endbachense TaxID=2666025 RepID=A0A6P1VWZ9_9BACT|nr:beta-ketoacyl-[acyl-carrier-protein] synthase family protein [Spirosoma endbachense]QHV96219.1 beta-ketoacyl-[acyl-carrier-protein] synthase family protein [Spirosoma endbachense]
MERVVVTGIGVCCSIGQTKDEFKDSVYNGRLGLKPIDPKRFPTDSACYANKQACVLDQDLYADIEASDETVLTYLGNRVIAEALNDASLVPQELNPHRAGLFVATTIGGSYAFMDFTKKRIQEGIEVADYELLFKASTPNITGSFMRALGWRGPSSTISTACAAGTNSIGRGFDFVAGGRVDVAVAGGIDIFTELSFAGFNSLQSLSKSICQPFDKNRDGLTLGDASAFVVLESLTHAQERGARIYCELKGYSANNEAHHPTAPTPDGSTAFLTMKQALQHGNMTADELDYINAHGTATGVNDSMELNGIGRLMNDRPVYISSTKSMIGHTLGAAGSIEFITTALGIYHSFVPPSCNVQTTMVADEGPIRLVQNRAIDQPIRAALSNSFGFGGCMASIALRRFDN